MSFSPKVRVILRLSKYEGKEIDLSSELISISTSKRYGNAAGGWQLAVPFRPLKEFQGLRYDEIVAPDDLVVIDMDAGDGNGYERVMVGLLSRAARFYYVTPDGSPQRAVKLTGLDLGKLLVRHNCAWVTAPRSGNELPPDILLLTRNVFFTGTAEKMVRSFFEDLFLTDVWQWADYYDYVSFTDDAWEMFNQAVSQQNGSAWDAMKQVSNWPYNILTTETVGDLNRRVLNVILEKIPINDDGKLNFPASDFLYLDPALIDYEDVGVSDDERVTYFWFKPPLTISGVPNETVQMFATPETVKILNGENNTQDDISIHGAIRHEIPCSFAKIDMANVNPAPPSYIQEAKARAEAFWNRYKDNHTLESGTFKHHLVPRLRAGSGVIHPGYGKEYLVEQVDHNCTFGENPEFKTTLQVTRGQNH